MKSSYSPRTPDMGRSRAFTLVEVLVVIAIISVLMAVLLPALSKARECAYLTGELTAGRELGQAHRMYAGDYNSYYMAGFASATMVAQRAVIAKDQKGDVLTGLITALACQGLSPYDAARLGVYLHGLAGDLAANELSQEAMIASDLIRYLPHAFHEYRKRTGSPR